MAKSRPERVDQVSTNPHDRIGLYGVTSFLRLASLPGFATEGAGQTMKRVVDLEGCSGTEPRRAMVSRATSVEGLSVLRGFDIKQILERISTTPNS